MATDRETLQAQIDDLKERIDKLEEYKITDVKYMVNMSSKVRELTLYGKSVYEAIQMLSEDYMNKSSGGVALYNGILSKLDKYDFVSQARTKPPKQEKWIVHRTLRKKCIETYVSYLEIDRAYFNNKLNKRIIPDYTYNKNYAKSFNKHQAIKVRDELNKDRVGKQYLWVISKVEE